MNEITGALRVIAAGWPGKVTAEQMQVWAAVIAEHAHRVPPGSITAAAKTLVVAGGEWPPGLGDFLAEMLGFNDFEPAESAWQSAYRPNSPMGHAATEAIGGQWAIRTTTNVPATRRAWIETYKAECERLKRAVLHHEVEPPRALAARGEQPALPTRAPALADIRDGFASMHVSGALAQILEVASGEQ